jgi:P4 family phage/plasmid primase-like protien
MAPPPLDTQTPPQEHETESATDWPPPGHADKLPEIRRREHERRKTLLGRLTPEAQAEAELLDLDSDYRALLEASLEKGTDAQVKRLQTYAMVVNGSIMPTSSAVSDETLSPDIMAEVERVSQILSGKVAVAQLPAWKRSPEEQAAMRAASTPVAPPKAPWTPGSESVKPPPSAPATTPAFLAPPSAADIALNQAQREAEALVAKTQAKAQKRQAKRNEKILAGTKSLTIGSDIEIARRVIEDLRAEHGEVIFDDGDVYRYDGMRWAALNSEELRIAVHPYDGAILADSETPVRLSKGRVDSVLSEMRAMLTQRDFFAEAPTGVNCKSGFIRFGAAGEADAEIPSLVPHDPDHRCRHVLPGKWQPDASGDPPDKSLLRTLLDGAFKGDDDAAEKVKLVRQIAGCAALGYATKLLRPKAIIAHGESAENGKSQVLDMLRGVLPKSAIASVPVTKLGDQSFLVRLAGKLLNATDELSGSTAITGDTFKACVTGETVTARDLYRSAIEFRPVALNVFATNVLPSFRGGFDRGVLRRLLVLVFNRVIPVDERVENIGQRIVEEEADKLLAFAVAGASDLIRERNFTVPSSSDDALKRWVRLADPVLGWAAARIKTDTPDKPKSDDIKSADAFGRFRDWALAAGYRPEHIPAINGFAQRLTGIPGISSKHRRTGNWLTGFSILPDDREGEG